MILIIFLFTLFNFTNCYKYNLNFNKNPYLKQNINHLDKNNINNINNLDKNNINNLEKLFYLRNNKYSPFKNFIYAKYLRNNENVTELLEQINNKFLEENKYMDDEFKKVFNNTFNLIENNIKKNKLNNDNNIYRDNKYLDENKDDNDEDYKDNQENTQIIDIFGVYKNSDSYKNRKNDMEGADLGSGGDFEIIKEATHTFKDIGGYKKIKEELNQVSDILINYKKYKKYNVRTPKGLIFEGPPGNGKTLLAKGFCGEVKSSFIPVSGSEFTEKYVGVGASRIRELFKLANKNSPCIIFIDEIDALGRKRGNDMVNTNSEKDQTLNQLLISLDGFKENDGVFIIGATNRIDLLDNALLRPGRIDKKIFIGNPDSETREKVINIHLKGKPISSFVEIDSIVQMTGGFSGAQIENLLNEAMLKSLRDNREQIEWFDLEYVANRILAGWQENESKFSDEMIDRIAVHELGHALVGFLSNDHSNVSKVTLNLWSPTSPGYTVFESNDQDSNIYTKEGLLSHLMVLLGGRIAEELFYGYSVTSGAKQDLEQAYELAKTMIINYGMGEKNIYPDLSDQSKYAIDQEVNKLLLEANERSYKIINDCKEIIKELSNQLKEDKVLKPEDIYKVVKKKYNRFMFNTNNQYYRMYNNEIN